jgi:hypothetical protein
MLVWCVRKMKAISFVQPMERLSHVSIESKLHGKRGWHAVSFGRRRGNAKVLLRVEMYLVQPIQPSNTTELPQT